MLCLEGKLREPVVRWLQAQQMTPVFEVYLMAGTCDIVGVQFGQRVGRLIPPAVQICAVELKLHDVAGVLRQAISNRYYVTHSWAAMPAPRVAKMASRTIRKFIVAGVGLLSVDKSVTVVVKPNPSQPDTCWFTNNLPRKLWRRREEWPERINKTKF